MSDVTDASTGSGCSTDAFGAEISAVYREAPAWIECDGERMLGIVCAPATGPRQRVGVLIVVGGPQYRVGSHRQFVRLARALAVAGHVSLRLDHRGVGDSEGRMRSFEEIDADLTAALDCLGAQPGVREIVVWGLCDAASAALMFCARDSRVGGLVLLNPWVRSDVTLATTYLKHYYGRRLLEPEFWKRVISRNLDLRASLRDFVGSARSAVLRRPAAQQQSFQHRMAAAWRSFRGPILLLLSGRDLTAREFLEYAAADGAWRGLLERPNVSRRELADADHTFSGEYPDRWMRAQTVEWVSRLAEEGRSWS